MKRMRDVYRRRAVEERAQGNESIAQMCERLEALVASTMMELEQVCPPDESGERTVS